MKVTREGSPFASASASISTSVKPNRSTLTPNVAPNRSPRNSHHFNTNTISSPSSLRRRALLKTKTSTILLLLTLLTTVANVVFYIHVTNIHEMEQERVQMMQPSQTVQMKNRKNRNKINKRKKRALSAIKNDNDNNNNSNSKKKNKGKESCSRKVLTPHYLEIKNIAKFTNTNVDDYKKVKPGYKVLVNGKEKTFERRALYPSCSISPGNPLNLGESDSNSSNSGPVPVLFLIDGRSGSSNTWLTLSKLAGEYAAQESNPGSKNVGINSGMDGTNNNNKDKDNDSDSESNINTSKTFITRGAKEALGSDQDQVRAFMKLMKTEEAGSWWLREHLCEVNRLQCKTAISGIQWKPYVNSWTMPAAQGILKEIARNNKLYTNDNTNINKNANKGKNASISANTNTNPKIKVLYMTRNPIDVQISRIKHRKGNVVATTAHCIHGDDECLKQHKLATRNLLLPTHDLVEVLHQNAEQTKLIVSTLEELGIDFYQTSYEKLYNAKDAEEWMRIFRYFGRGPMEGLTLDDVQNAFHLAKTTDISRRDLLSNYEDVEKVLKESGFLHLLDE